MNKETAIQHAVRAALVRSGDVLLWRCNGGFDKQTKVRYGLGLGAADLIGIQRSTGRFVGVEIKSERGRLSPDQERWGKAVADAGGIYIVARSPEEALSKLAIGRA